MKEYIGFISNENEVCIDETQPIVRCRDCSSVSFDEFGGGWCHENRREINGLDFCAWGERKEKTSTDLRPCPFCGGEALIVHIGNTTCYVVCENRDCMAKQKLYGTKAEAIAAWNARA